MSKSPVTLATLAAFAAAVTIGILTQDGIAQENPAAPSRQPATTMQRLPVQLVPAPGRPGRPAQPQRRPMLQVKQAEPKTPGSYVGGGAKGGPDTPSQLANLVVIPYYTNPDSLPEGFPTHSYCMKKPTGGTPDHIRFYIRNVGGSASGGFQWTPSFPNAGAAPAHVLPSIPANGQVLITQPIPNGCYTPGFNGVCQFSIHLDDHDEVEEWSEANSYSSYCVSPAG